MLRYIGTVSYTHLDDNSGFFFQFFDALTKVGLPHKQILGGRRYGACLRYFHRVLKLLKIHGILSAMSAVGCIQ